MTKWKKRMWLTRPSWSSSCFSLHPHLSPHHSRLYLRLSSTQVLLKLKPWGKWSTGNCFSISSRHYGLIVLTKPQGLRRWLYILTGLNCSFLFHLPGFSKAVLSARDTFSPHLLAWIATAYLWGLKKAESVLPQKPSLSPCPSNLGHVSLKYW